MANEEDIRRRRREFEKLAMPAVDTLYRQAMKYTNNAEDAQDLVQDTFERGFKAFDSFDQHDSKSNIEAWLTTILRNAYFNQYAKIKRRPQRANASTGEYDDWDIYAASEHSGEGLKSAEQEYLDTIEPREIMTALSHLSPERRQVFIDAAIDGKSYQQVADEQGVKIGTVMSRLNRARTQLRKELAPYARELGYGRDLRESASRAGKASSRAGKAASRGPESEGSGPRTASGTRAAPGAKSRTASGAPIAEGTSIAEGARAAAESKARAAGTGDANAPATGDATVSPTAKGGNGATPHNGDGRSS